MEINYEELDRAIAGDNTALITAFNWEDTPQGDTYWYNQYRGKTPLDIDALRAIREAPTLQVGEAPTEEAGIERESLFVDGYTAMIVVIFLVVSVAPFAIFGPVWLLAILVFILSSPLVSFVWNFVYNYHRPKISKATKQNEGK